MPCFFVGVVHRNGCRRHQFGDVSKLVSRQRPARACSVFADVDALPARVVDPSQPARVQQGFDAGSVVSSCWLFQHSGCDSLGVGPIRVLWCRLRVAPADDIQPVFDPAGFVSHHPSSDRKLQAVGLLITNATHGEIDAECFRDGHRRRSRPGPRPRVRSHRQRSGTPVALRLEAEFEPWVRRVDRPRHRVMGGDTKASSTAPPSATRSGRSRQAAARCRASIRTKPGSSCPSALAQCGQRKLHMFRSPAH